MKQLPESVKQAEIEKYSFRAKRIGDMRDWWVKNFCALNSPFCSYFNPNLQKSRCPCPLFDGTYEHSCCGKEYGAIIRAENENDVPGFNAAMEAFQNRLRALPTKEEKKVGGNHVNL